MHRKSYYNTTNLMENILSLISSSSPYDVLGISPMASDDEVNAAFKKLALVCHPDKSLHPRAEEVFKIVSKARDEIIKGDLLEKLQLQRKLYTQVLETVTKIKTEVQMDYERERAFVEKFGRGSGDQWRDDGVHGWPILPRKTQRADRGRKQNSTK